MCPGNQGALAGSFGGSPALRKPHSRICAVSVKQRRPSGQFWWASSIKGRRARGFAMAPGNYRLAACSCDGSQVLRKAQSRICDVSRKQRCSSGQFWWVSSTKESALEDLRCGAQRFAVSSGNKCAQAGSFGWFPALRTGLEDLRCRGHGFTMSPGDKCVPAGSFGGSSALRSAPEDLRCRAQGFAKSP